MRLPPSWLGLLVAVTGACATSRPNGPAGNLATRAAAPTLRFEDFFDPQQTRLVPSSQLLAAQGRRIRLVGFMAQMETPPAQGFYLTRRPVACDEAGGGTADLPPDAVRVLITPAPAHAIPYVPGPIDITGVLETGPKDEPDGTVTHIRLLIQGG